MSNNKNVIYYTDPLNDDFADNITKEYAVNDEFKYKRTNPVFRFFSYILYHIIAMPIFYCILKIKYHVKVFNKDAIKNLDDTGYFIYMNHSQNIIDAFINHALVCPNRNGHIIANNDVYSLKPLKTIIDMLGTLPTPNNLVQSKKLYDAIEYYTNKKDVTVILPEAHVWPYYNDIRPFLDTSFIYPARLNKPIVVTTVVYRARKNRDKKPYISLYISKPIYPKPVLSIKENQKYLRDEAYNFMKQTVKEQNSFAHIQYIKKTDEF